MGNTKISWTDKVWNCVIGCTRKSSGCVNCYAETLHNMRHKAFNEGKQLPKQYSKPFNEIQLLEDRLNQPLHWKKPAKIFVNSMSDLFHDKVSYAFIYKVMTTIKQTPQHIYQILTKRPGNIFSRLPADGLPDNVWLGVSIENQKTADERIPVLLEIPAKVRFLSIEPLLEPLGMIGELYPFIRGNIHQVIVGCESGAKRRPCKLEWIEKVVEQCGRYNIPVFVKQMEINGKVETDINKFPKHLQIQEFPK